MLLCPWLFKFFFGNKLHTAGYLGPLFSLDITKASGPDEIPAMVVRM